ncbi:hypothetical protein SAMN02910447_01910 [Ruminococcus sp. YE71]|uniref:AlkZ-related protein n=1 Tax=unclassified Ruminococcus TaxID=2608920 RepID=UPI00088CD713|nr:MULTISPECIES: hypothetical protein [unclassified Ruminococcus]SDA20645.1 hypothetical protein SAMN02910446_01760 [Ruminococcus sp. YE78]SFW33871.1 hypothetical protein SAMN02910447_01910 [Ruminococcus sp. YE71]
MEVINGQFIMRGLSENDPLRIMSHSELVAWVKEIGFLPLFANEIEGFSAEEHVSPRYWWTGNREQDPWEWREIIASGREVAYGKFFGGKAGFISTEWLPVFANYRRGGYDFDSRWDDGLANRREKLIMDMLTERDSDGDIIRTDKQILSSDLKKLCGFGKGGEKNFPGIITGLMMQTYLTITDFHRRRNKKGAEYGMPVSVLLPPEAVWGYELVTSCYDEAPSISRERIVGQVRALFPNADEESIGKVIGKAP